MELNVLRYPSCRSRVMIYNLQSARELMKQCKRSLIIKLPSSQWLEITSRFVSKHENLDDWVCVELERATGQEAACLIWKYRKYINAHFKD